MSAAAQRSVTALQGEISAIQSEISARTQQTAAIRSVTAAIKEQGEAAAVVHRTLQQGIDTSFGVGGDRAIKSASASAAVLATSLSAAAEADARLRNEALATAAALERQGNAVRTLSGEQFFSTFQRRQGIGQQPLSAERSAAAFSSQLGPAGTGITSADTRRTIDDLHGVNRELLSAKDSAAVFASAGLTVTETELGMTAASVAAAAAAERATSRIASGAASSTREVRHLVAAFDELSRGQRGALFGTMGAAMRDSGAGAVALTSSVAGLVAVLGTAAILHHAEELGKWATEAKAAASATGMSIESYTGLQGAFELIGEKGEQADRTLVHIAKTLSEAIADPASKSAQAIHNMTINQQQLTATGGDVGKFLSLLADAWVRTEDGANKTANMTQIAGERFKAIVPALQEGSEGFARLEAKVDALGKKLTIETANKLEAAGRSVEELNAKIRGEGVQAFAAWGAGISSFSELLGVAELGLLRIIRDIGDLPKNINIVLTTLHIDRFFKAGSSVAASGQDAEAGAMPFAPKPPGGRGPGGLPVFTDQTQPQPYVFPHTPLKTQVPPLTPSITPQEQTAHDIAQAGLKAAQGGGDSRSIHMAETQAEIAEIKKRVAAAQDGSKEKLQAETELYRKQTELLNEQASAGGAAAKQGTRDFIADEKLKLAEAQGNSQKIKAIYDEMIAYTTAKYGAGAAETLNIEREKVQAINAARQQEISDRAKQAEVQERSTRQDATLNTMAQGKFTYQGQEKSEPPSADIARSQQYLAEANKITATFQSAIAEQNELASTAEAGSKSQQEAQQKIVELTANYKAQEIALYEKAGSAAVAAINKLAAPWNNLFSGIGSAFDTLSSSIIKDLIAPQQDLIKVGLTTIKFNEQGNEMRAAFRTAITSIASNFAQTIESAIGNTIAHALSNVISGVAGNTMGELLSSALQKAVGSIFGSAAGSALGNVAGSAAGSVGGAAATTAAIAAGATATTTGISTAVATAAGLQITAITAASTAIVGAITTASVAEDALLVGVNAKPSLLGFTYAQGGIVPSAAGGMVVGGGSGASLAILHPQEMVLPANISNGLQAAIAGGSGSSGASAASALSATVQGSGAAVVNALTSTQAENLNALNNIQNTLAQQPAGQSMDTSLVNGLLAVSGFGGGKKGLIGDLIGLPFLGALAGGGIIPSAAGGMVGGMGATLAVLHAREMVLPANISQGLQGMIARGGNTSIGGNSANLNYSPTINAGRGRSGSGMSRGEFAQMMALHSGAMMGEARNMIRAGFRG